MNPNPRVIRKALLFVLGAGLGATVGYFAGGLIVYKLNEKDNCPDDMDLVKVVEDGPDDQPKPDGIEQPPVVITENGKLYAGKKPAKLDYARISKEASPAEELQALASKYTTSWANGGESKDPAATSEPAPYIITQEAYIGYPQFKKDVLTYYTNDTTYADAEDQIVSDPVALVGPNAHLHFGELSEDPEIVYFRNERIGVDYEVTCVENAYSVVVLGMEPEPPKKSAKPRTRKAKKTDEEESES